MTRSIKRDSDLDAEILHCLQDVIDPEIGLSIVDLGLVYRARRTAEAIEVAVTLTSRACPLAPPGRPSAESSRQCGGPMRSG